jgi:hypothetical protein
MSAADLLLPEGTRLLHIGPPKTGSSALQVAMHQLRSELAAHGVHYAGETRQAYEPAIAVTEKSGQPGRPTPSIAAWEALVAEVRAVDDSMRTVISSEYFAAATPAQIARIARDLDPERVHVVRMLRRYDRQLPSYWQQIVSSGIHETPYGPWLDEILSRERMGFWRRQSYGAATQRWVEHFGADRVTAVVVDETDHDWLLRVMERLVGLPVGLLTASADADNRSLGYGEAEMLRLVCAHVRDNGWRRKILPRYLRWGVVPAIRHLPKDPLSGRMAMLSQHQDQVDEIAEREIADLTDLGVRVVGELDWLRPDRTGPAPLDASRPTVRVQTPVIAVTSIADKVARPKVRLLYLRSKKRPMPRIPPGPTVPAETVRVQVLAPWQLLVESWQQHLLERGETPWAQWLEQHPRTALAEQTQRVENALSKRGWRRVLGKAVEIEVVDLFAVGDGRTLLTWPEAEGVRQLNRASQDWPDERWARHVRDGVVGHLLSVDADRSQGDHPFPADLADELATAGARLAALLAARRADVSGNIQALSALTHGDAADEPRLSSAAAAEFLVGALISTDAGWDL